MPGFQRKNDRPLPRLWLFTDERVEESALIAAIGRLPRGAGIVFRHYGWPVEARRRLFDRVRTAARSRRVLLLLAGPAELARRWGADGWHAPAHMPVTALGAGARRGLIHSRAAHDATQLRRAVRDHADIAFLSPVFATRSHAGGRVLGPLRFASLLRRRQVPVVALGGMTPARARRMMPMGAYGWAGIDALSGRVRRMP